MVQGFGNAGSIAAELFAEAGASIVGVSDSRGGVYQPKGFDPTAARKHKEKIGSVVGLSNTKSVSNEELLALPCDILIPAALENQIRSDNADQVASAFPGRSGQRAHHPGSRPHSFLKKAYRCSPTYSPTREA